MATILVHAGAGSAQDDRRAHDAVCRAAVAAARTELERGRDAVEAATAAVACLEDDPSTNAGLGSCLNTAGFVELDALVVEGRDLRLGAVAVVRDVANPVYVARLILDEVDVNLLAGEGASSYARARGITTVDPERLVTERQRQRLRAIVAGAEGDTVGAIVVDDDHHSAVAVSTGGVPGKRPGRVGDSPLVGAGAWADDRIGAATATGYGEGIMRVLLAREAVAGLERGLDPTAAAVEAIRLLEQRVQGRGGVLVVDRRGRVGTAFNTPQMCHATWSGGAIEARCDGPITA